MGNVGLKGGSMYIRFTQPSGSLTSWSRQSPQLMMREYGQKCYPGEMLERVDVLTPAWGAIAGRFSPARPSLAYHYPATTNLELFPTPVTPQFKSFRINPWIARIRTTRFTRSRWCVAIHDSTCIAAKACSAGTIAPGTEAVARISRRLGG